MGLLSRFTGSEGRRDVRAASALARDRLDPYSQAGRGMLARLSSGALDFHPDRVDIAQDPGYQFRAREGQQALERGAAARGKLLSGGTLRALLQYGQNLASQEYGNAYTRSLEANRERYARAAGLAGMGYDADAALAGIYSRQGEALARNAQSAANNATRIAGRWFPP